MLTFTTFLEESVGLRRNAELNPALWDGDSLRRDVAVALQNFGEAWRRFAKIPEEAVLDVVMVGGNAGYFYNEASDIDVHLIVDKSKLGFGPMVDEYLRDKKALWTVRHDVRVRGYQLEPYAQDVSEGWTVGQGVYSVKNGQWIQRPIDVDYDPAADHLLKKKVDHWQAAIDKLVGGGAEIDEFDAMKNKLSEMRSRGLSRGGELARDNLVFKALRLSGHLDKMSDYVKKKTSERLSLA